MSRRTAVAPDVDRDLDRATVPDHAAVTCAHDGRSHAVPHAVLAESLAAGTGRCTAVCGHIVLPASLASPPGSSCLLCAEATGVGGDRREPRRRWYAGRDARGSG